MLLVKKKNLFLHLSPFSCHPLSDFPCFILPVPYTPGSSSCPFHSLRTRKSSPLLEISKVNDQLLLLGTSDTSQGTLEGQNSSSLDRSFESLDALEVTNA